MYPFNFGEFLRAGDLRLEKIYRDRSVSVNKWLLIWLPRQGISWYIRTWGRQLTYYRQTRKHLNILVEVKYSGFEREKISRSLMNFTGYFKPERGIVLTKNFRGKSKTGKTEFLFAPAYYL